jgi:hypothetical protein
MLTPRQIILTLALLVALIADSWGQSQRPPPNGAKTVQPPSAQAEKSNSNPAADQRGTEQMPLIVTIAPTQESAERAAAEAKRDDQKAANDKTIARFTKRLFWATVALSVVAIFQFFAFLWQGRQLQRSVTLARQEFNATHRPKIRVHAVEWKPIPPPADATENDVSNRLGASLICFNYGAATAKIIEIRGQIFTGANFALDVQRPLVKSFENVVSGEKFRADIDSGIPISTVAAGKRTGIDYHCIGWVAYWDENGLRRESGFCYRAAPFAQPRERWERTQDREYDYEY